MPLMVPANIVQVFQECGGFYTWNIHLYFFWPRTTHPPSDRSTPYISLASTCRYSIGTPCRYPLAILPGGDPTCGYHDACIHTELLCLTSQTAADLPGEGSKQQLSSSTYACATRANALMRHYVLYGYHPSSGGKLQTCNQALVKYRIYSMPYVHHREFGIGHCQPGCAELRMFLAINLRLSHIIICAYLKSLPGVLL